MKLLARRILVITISGLLIFSVAGCSQTSKGEATTPEATLLSAVDESAEEIQGTVAQNEEEPFVSSYGEDFEIVITVDGETVAEKDIDFQIGPIMVGTPMAAIATLLGQPDEEEKPQYQGYDNKWHQSVSYKNKGISLQICSAEENGEYVVERVSVTSPFGGKSAKGICIGSSDDEVRAAYSDMINPEDSSETVIVLGSVYWGVHFHIGNEGAVESITFGANAE